MRNLASPTSLFLLVLFVQSAYAQWEWEVLDLGFEDVLSQPAALQSSLIQGEQLFATYCAACHGAEGTGMPGVPNLVDQETLWGNDLAAMAYVIKYGIRSEHEKARFSQMPAYGLEHNPYGYDEQMLSDLTHYVAHLRGESVPQESISRAENIMIEVCTECHGYDYAGQVDWYGAPSLLDDVSLYGHDDATVYDVIAKGREGHSPVWESILADEQIRDISLYIESLRR
ncbi:MAG: c-type cytochrome [Porticoccaceae bacterium]|jgi:cytochrome c oxidase cbb3-type subunit III|nr:c-type cytochrome [Porticoccaceae bacterium]